MHVMGHEVMGVCVCGCRARSVRASERDCCLFNSDYFLLFLCSGLEKEDGARITDLIALRSPCDCGVINYRSITSGPG